MLNSQTLKTFVKMHEYKLNAKINALRVNRLHDHLEHEIDLDLSDADDVRQAPGDDRYMHRLDPPEHRRRPKSRYFNFIMTAHRH